MSDKVTGSQINKILEAVDRESKEIAGISRKIQANPELAFHEKFAVNILATYLEKLGFTLENPFCGYETAFIAKLGNSKPQIAILAEYDALPELGHACGHHLIAGTALAAAAGLAIATGDHNGQVAIIGTPAEESGGGKIRLLEAGAFEDTAAALMCHPLDRTILYLPTLANAHIRVSFKGKQGHAGTPSTGRNALLPAIHTFNMIDAGRPYIKDSCRINGIITRGGQLVNVIPGAAECEFGVRGPTARDRQDAINLVLRSAQGAALAGGIESDEAVTIDYGEMLPNWSIARSFGRHWSSLGGSFVETEDTEGYWSTDAGDVSQKVPTLHSYFQICEAGPSLHQVEFFEAAAEDRAYSAMLNAGKALALTAFELLVDPDSLKSVGDEYKNEKRRSTID